MRRRKKRRNCSTSTTRLVLATMVVMAVVMVVVMVEVMVMRVMDRVQLLGPCIHHRLGSVVDIRTVGRQGDEVTTRTAVARVRTIGIDAGIGMTRDRLRGPSSAQALCSILHDWPEMGQAMVYGQPSRRYWSLDLLLDDRDSNYE